jgi:hypothetical protein
MSRLPRLYGGCSYFRKLSYYIALPIGSTPRFGTFLSPTLQPPSSNWIYYWRSEASRSTPRHQKKSTDPQPMQVGSNHPRQKGSNPNRSLLHIIKLVSADKSYHCNKSNSGCTYMSAKLISKIAGSSISSI